MNPVDGTQTVVSPVATQPNKFAAPTGIAIAATGDLFVSDGACCGGNGGVIRVNPVDGTQTVVSPVAARPNRFVTPTGIAIAITGDLFATDGERRDGSGAVIPAECR